MKYFIILCLIGLTAGKPPCLSCQTIEERNNIRKTDEVLKNSLSKLAAGDGPVYRLVKINYATKQVVPGSRDIINADLKDKDNKIKTCNIDIWSRSWLENGVEVTFDCPGEEKVVRKHSP